VNTEAVAYCGRDRRQVLGRLECFCNREEWVGVKGENVWTVLTNSIGAKRQPLVIQITTAGVSGTDTVCERQYQQGRLVETGEAMDPTFRWWEAEATNTANSSGSVSGRVCGLCQPCEGGEELW
jgi:hypothetical protein